jgi:O-antigen ligase
MPLAIAIAVGMRRPIRRWIAAGLAATAAAAIVVTFSRSGFLALVTMLSFYLLSWLRQGRVARVGLVATLAVAGVLMLPSGYSHRLATISAIESDPTGSAQARWNDMQAALVAVAQAPLTGAGIGQDILVLNEIRGEAWISVHNVYLQYAVDLGLPGLILFCGLLGTVLAGTVRTERRLRAAVRSGAPAQAYELARAIRISLMTFAVAAMFYPVAYYFYFYYLAGLAVAVQRTAALSQRR